jgi:hypothetical protein
MKPRTMNFSRDWKKLNDRMFATIRIHRGDLKFSPDETVEVVSPKKEFRARVLLACNGKLYKFSEQPKQTDTVTVYFLEKQ